jgi:universal stress protein family protein
MGTIIVVANQTLPSEALATEVAGRIAAGKRTFHVVVPATPPPGGGFTWDEEAARVAAQDRLAAFLERLREKGATASGETGDRDPVAAVRDAARGLDVDEVILSTLPLGASRWLRQDVPSRMRGALPVPVAVVIEQETSAVGR